MKKITLLLVTSWISVHLFAQGITFEHGDLASVKAKAKASGKMIFVDVYTYWCGPCKKMAQTTFQQPTVGGYFNNQFINYKIDAEKGEGVEFAKKYAVKFYPTYLFIDGDGNLFGKAIGYCVDTTFIAIAKKAVGEYSDPGNLARMQADYERKKNDTAFLRRYIDKLNSNEHPATSVIEQYLAVQTGIPDNSKQMLNFLTQHWKHLIIGGKADQLLNSNIDSYRKLADSQQLKTINEARWILLSRTYEYAKDQPSEALMNTYFAEWQKLPSTHKVGRTKESIWLDFYSSAGQWDTYRKYADRWLDSIVGLYTDLPVPAVEMKVEGMTRKPVNIFNNDISPERKRDAYLVYTHALIYYQQFGKDPKVLKKTRDWTERALAINETHYKIQSSYANFLYLTGDSPRAIRWKKSAIKQLSKESPYRPPLETNLAHIQNEEALEDE